MEPFTLAVGGGIALLFFIIGRVNRKPQRDPSEPICACGHALAYHDPKTNECHKAVTGKPIRYDVDDLPTAWETVQCSCRQYVGPLPAEMMLSLFQQPAGQLPVIDVTGQEEHPSS